MHHLSQSYIVYLQDTYENITRRTSLKNRGIVSPYSSNFKDIYLERISLYKKYAHLIFDMPFPFHGHNATGLLIKKLAILNPNIIK